MDKTISRPLSLVLVSLFLLLLLLSACEPAPGSSGSGPGKAGSTAPAGKAATTAIPSAAVAQPTGTPEDAVPMPPTQTTCPTISPGNPFGTRPVVMRPMALGSHQSIIYIYNEVPPQTSTSSGHLVRYDVTTGQRVTIATSGLRISEAQVFADGQWIMFLSIADPRSDPNHVALLQMVRMDGQGLQTLYCFPSQVHYTPGQDGRPSISFQWSLDELHVVLSSDMSNSISHIDLLNITTGQLEPKVIMTDPLYSYRALTWLDHNRVYILKEGRQGPPPPVTLYLLDIRTRVGNPAAPPWSTVLTHQIRFSKLALDSSFDGSRLFVSSCLQAASPFDSTVSVGPATGGAQQTIYHTATTMCLDNMRVINNRQLLLLVRTTTASGTHPTEHVALLATDGSGGLHLLNNLPPDNTYDFNTTTQVPWSNISIDESLYALNAWDANRKQSTIYYGSLSDGDVTIAATTTTGTLDLAGWSLS